MGLETPTVGLQVQPLESRSNYNPVGATAAMIEAFRNGQISTADIIERSTKMPALRQQVADATDPAQVAARKEILLQNAQQEAIATEQNRFALKQAEDLAKIPPTVRAKADELAKHGALDPNFSPASYDENQKAIIEARWNSLQKWKRNAELALATAKQIEDKDAYDGAGNPLGKKPAVGEKRVNDAAHSSLNKYIASYATPTAFNDWLKDGSPEPHTDLFNAPKGAVVQNPQGAPSGKVIDPNAPTIAAGVKTAGDILLPPAGQSTLTVEANFDPSSLGVPKVKADPVPRNTEKQASAQYFVTRAQESNGVIDKLTKGGFDPASASTYAQGYLVGPLKGLKEQEVKQYEFAKEAWIQGLLRMESGAAIAKKEQAWYEDTFFPQVGDGPEIQAQKAALRKSMERTSLQVAANDPLGEKALAEYDIRSDENHKLYSAGKLEGTQPNKKKNASDAKPITVDGQKWESKVVNGRTLVRQVPTGQSTNSAAPLPVNKK